MEKYDQYTWIIALVVIYGGWWLLVRLRMRRERSVSDALCARFGCKALPVHVFSGIRLVFDQPTWGGCLVIMGVGSTGVGAIGSPRFRRVRVTMWALTRSVCPPVLLSTRSRGWEQRVSEATFPSSTVDLGEPRFQSAFAAHADSLTIAETAFSPRVQSLAAGIADVAGLMPAPDMTHAIVNLFVEMLESDKDKRQKGDRSTDEVSVQRWGTSLVVTVRAPNRQFFSTEKSVLDQVPEVIGMATAVVASTARLQREFDSDGCRACADPRREPPTRVCKRCGASYHHACLSLLSGSASCPVWGCGDTKEQLLTLCERYARRSWFDFWKQALGLPRRESFDTPTK